MPKFKKSIEAIDEIKPYVETTPEQAFKLIDEMVADWPSPIVPRKSLSEFSGGVLSSKYAANLDSLKIGIEGAFLVMGKVVYPKENVGKFLKTRVSPSWKERKVA